MTCEDLIKHLSQFPKDAKIVTKGNYKVYFQEYDFNYDEKENVIYIIS